jgi:hypothetical protein
MPASPSTHSTRRSPAVASAFFAGALLLALAGCASTPPPPRFFPVTAERLQRAGTLSPESGTVLPDAAAPQLFKQCSRPAPAFSGALWQPTADDLARFESAFPAYYAQQLPDPRPLTRYRRQYAGFVSAQGKKLIYANFFPLQIPAKEDQARDPVRYDPDLWKKEAYIACDGGFTYFGAVFDPATGLCSDLEGNGF